MCTVLVGEHERRQPLGRWENTIKMDLKEIGLNEVGLDLCDSG
jgi:hypothetical protein